MNSDNTRRTAAQNTKKPYVKPTLKTIGCVSELTLKGGSATDAMSTYTA